MQPPVPKIPFIPEFLKLTQKNSVFLLEFILRMSHTEMRSTPETTTFIHTHNFLSFAAVFYVWQINV